VSTGCDEDATSHMPRGNCSRGILALRKRDDRKERMKIIRRAHASRYTDEKRGTRERAHGVDGMAASTSTTFYSSLQPYHKRGGVSTIVIASRRTCE